MQKHITALMGTGSDGFGCSPTCVHIYKGNRLEMEAMQELLSIGVAVQTGTRCDGDVLVFESAWNHFHGDSKSKAQGLD